MFCQTLYCDIKVAIAQTPPELWRGLENLVTMLFLVGLLSYFLVRLVRFVVNECVRQRRDHSLRKAHALRDGRQ